MNVFFVSISVIEALPPIQSSWFIYILQTSSGALYTGITTDVQRRLRQHNGELNGGAKALRGKGPLTLLSVWQVPSRRHALQFEYSIKRMKKADKLALIQQFCLYLSTDSSITAQKIQ